MNIAGISALFHDSAACLLQDGRLAAAAQEERFSRKKHDSSMPRNAFRFCLEQGGTAISDVDCIAYYENPCKKLERQIWMLLPDLSAERCLELWQRATQPVREIREVLGYEGRIEIVDHHMAHAASSYYFSGFEDAAILTVDSVGEWATTAYWHGRGDDIELIEQVEFPHSLGLCYSAITSYLGFGVNDGECKLMGLAPYGQPVWRQQIRELVHSEPLGQFRIDARYFQFLSERRMYSDALADLLGHPPRKAEDPITQFHTDLARSIQCVVEEILLEKAEYVHRATGSKRLCMAGGVALNCVANGRIRRECPFEDMFVQPAAGDAGGCLGAAAAAFKRLSGKRAPLRRMEHVFLGPEYGSAEIGQMLAGTAIRAYDYSGREDELLEHVVELLTSGKIIGWYQGRMEFGPRALGARSILADARDPGMRDRINCAVKRRESFRPFAPAVLASDLAAHFDLDHASPFMLETCQVKDRSIFPAATHVDGSARVQTVHENTNLRFARLLARYGARTGCPVLLNTSFNVRDEPIVCTPVDALLCFAGCEIDALVIEDFVIPREQVRAAWEGLLHRRRPDPECSIADRVYRLF